MNYFIEQEQEYLLTNDDTADVILGTCVSVLLIRSTGGFAINHMMYPRTAAASIHRLVELIGSRNVAAKIIGGKMSYFDTSEQILDLARSTLKIYKIPVIGEDCLGDMARARRVHVTSGTCRVRYLGDS